MDGWKKKKEGSGERKRWRDPDSGQGDDVTTNKTSAAAARTEREKWAERTRRDEMKEGSQA